MGASSEKLDFLPPSHELRISAGDSITVAYRYSLADTSDVDEPRFRGGLRRGVHGKRGREVNSDVNPFTTTINPSTPPLKSSL
jgi:hypothetical protein